MKSTYHNLSWGSHVPVLLHCLHFTEGPVLEFGCGMYSTAILSMYSHLRYCLSMETNRDWHEKVKSFFPTNTTEGENRGHDILLVDDYRSAPVDDRNWSVVFVDQEESFRSESAQKIRYNSRIVVVHDTNSSWVSSALNGFRYRYDFRDTFPHTGIASETEDLSELVESLQSFFKGSERT